MAVDDTTTTTQQTLLTGESWAHRTARAGMPILVEFARQRRVITYGEWDAEIIRRGLGGHKFLILYGQPAGLIGDACEELASVLGRSVPMLNLMVVNQQTQMPGRGADYYIKKYCRDFLDRDVDPNRLASQERRAIIEKAKTEIFDYDGWPEVLGAFGLEESLRTTAPAARRKPNPNGWHTGQESDQHKALKALIAANPKLVLIHEAQTGKQEFPLWSGDRLDVYFPKCSTGVEAKTKEAGFDELHRGIFQCVKYKAVLGAQQIHERMIPTADCILAIGGSLPKELLGVAKLLGVKVVEGLE